MNIKSVMPLCELSQKGCKKFCINANCQLCAFICETCQQKFCEQAHYHNQKLQIIEWAEFESLIQNIYKSNEDLQIQSSVNIIEEKIDKLIGELNLLLKEYRSRMQSSNKIKFNKQFEEDFSELRQNKFKMVPGKKMNVIFKQLKETYKLKKQQEKSRAHEINNINNALDVFKKAIDQYINNQEVQLFENWSKQDREKLKKLSDDIKNYPNKTQYYSKRGLFYKDKFQNQKALADFRKILQLDPKSQKCYNNIGLVYHQMHQNQLAIQFYTKAIQVNPRYQRAYYNRGVVYYQNNQLDKAMNDYNKALQSDPLYSYAYNGRAALYQKKNMNQQALKDYTKAIECDNNTKYGYKNRAALYRKLKMNKKAQQDEKKHAQNMKK